jgi:hypothetical protein
MPPAPRHPATDHDRPHPTVTVVIPALNEEHNLPLILENLPPVDEVIVVDGRSQDPTAPPTRAITPGATPPGGAPPPPPTARGSAPAVTTATAARRSASRTSC